MAGSVTKQSGSWQYVLTYNQHLAALPAAAWTPLYIAVAIGFAVAAWRVR